MRIPPRAGPLLVLDSGSPLVSVALGREGAPLAVRAEEISRSSTRLLEMVDEVLAAAGMGLAEVGGVAALAGPGSFTGLRIGLATVLGFQQALGLPATAVPTLRVLASLAPPRAGRACGAVDSLRGEWAVEEWRAGERVDGMRLLPAAELSRLAPCAFVGFGVSRLRALPGWPADAQAIEPGPLAPAALALLVADEIAEGGTSGG
ncbi:MAG TPA: tRNA (adenosine(37)-N6)-threonylcarbamoyltransferase complex dimerization subunit type 1 TsaB, partial [Thermoanaerobaculia bacterium]|nr:tRNA (adenosine(37)-N6)-threonylcarbamoyltransferase complex dimerization subunit type 1 TsaB [Thermoanaerobaculia bacterium]